PSQSRDDFRSRLVPNSRPRFLWRDVLPEPAPARRSIQRIRVGFSLSIVLAVESWQIFGDPLKSPTSRPRFRVCARIVDRDLVLQRVEIRASKALNQVKLFGVRQSAVTEPEFLIERF